VKKKVTCPSVAAKDKELIDWAYDAASDSMCGECVGGMGCAIVIIAGRARRCCCRQTAILLKELRHWHVYDSDSPSKAAVRDTFCADHKSTVASRRAGRIAPVPRFLAAAVDARGQSSVRLNEVRRTTCPLTNVGGTVTDWIELANTSERSLISPTRA